MMYFSYFQNDVEREVQGSGWLIGTDGQFLERERICIKMCPEIGEYAKKMMTTKLALSSDLLLDWVFLPQAGHFFRVVQRPECLTLPQIEVVRELSEMLMQEWNVTKKSKIYGGIARIKETWAIPEMKMQQTNVSLGFRVFPEGIDDGDWTTVEMRLLMAVDKLMEKAASLGKNIEFDAEKKMFRVTNSRGETKFYRLEPKEVQKLRNSVNVALKRARDKSILGGAP